MPAAQINTDILGKLIEGRVDPHIYAFTTETVPNYLKIGDTYRPVGIRIAEWRRRYRNLKHIYTQSARIDEGTIFRDYSVHEYLEKEKSKKRLMPDDITGLEYYSNEFFKDAGVEDVEEAINDIKTNARDNTGKYQLYTTDHLPKKYTNERGPALKLRDNQQEVVENFKKAIKNNRTDLLMYAVMRFGKSFTAMCCAKEMDAKLVLVVSAKAGVESEWKHTVEAIGNFEGYKFINKDDLGNDQMLIQRSLERGEKVVLFLTLQDLQGPDIKARHNEVFDLTWDMLIVDETHFAARAKSYGYILANKYKADEINEEITHQSEDVETLEDVDKHVKEFKTRITLHLSGTPYRILTKNEFEKEDIIAFVQFADIVDAQQRWIEEHKFDEEKAEWENPYFGFPQMIRFAFTPNQASLDKLNQLKAESGGTTSFAELFRPKSLTVKTTNSHREFVHSDVVLDFLKVIDGAKNDANVLGFLDNERIKEGKLCRHMVMVLPYCASCDAMEEMLRTHSSEFRNLKDYEVINISGVDSRRRYANVEDVKRHIVECERNDKKTITLTVNRMLTGNTVPQWDTMLFLKQTHSAEEYDQAIFRLQNPYIDVYDDNKGHIIKYNLKPQTILVDFDPERVFTFQERKSLIYNINVENNGNSRLSERLEKELAISPIITLNHNKLVEVTATNIMEAILDYASTQSMIDEASDMPVDESLLDIEAVRQAIATLNPIDPQKGLKVDAHKSKIDNGMDVDPEIADEEPAEQPPIQPSAKSDSDTKTTDENDEKTLAKKLASYYALILFFSFLTDDTVKSLEDIIIAMCQSRDNRRISNNLGLSAEVLSVIQQKLNGQALSDLDYKIEKTNRLSRDSSKTAARRVEIALTKFGRMSESEIVTPSHVADSVVGLLPDDVAAHGSILDLASKQGEFASALLRRFGPSIADKVYSVCTSPLAYEFTRKVYKLLSLPVEHVFDKFTSYQLINKNSKGEFEIPQEIREMKISAIVGNPPYQEVNEGNGNGANPLYHLFIDLGRQLAPIGSMIHPARFLFKAGKTPKDWNEKILSDPHFRVVDYWVKSIDVFSNVDVKGGIAITMWNENENCGPIGFFSPYPEVRNILSKVKQNDFQSFSDLVYPRDLYKLTEKLYEENPFAEGRQSQGHRLDIGSSIFDIFPEIFFDVAPNESEYIGIYGLLGRDRVTKWIKRDYVKLPDNIDKYKVFVPKSNGTGAIGEVLSTPVIGVPVIGHTLTFLSIGGFKEAPHAEACLKYIKTRFARLLLGTLKVTQDNPKDTWANVPMQDFTEGSDIDWSVSVEEIDRQLYRKYGLSADETAFIEQMIKPM